MKLGRSAGLGAVGLVTFLVAWELFARSADSALVPPPSAIPAALVSEIENGVWQRMVLASFGHYVIGFLIGSSLGVLCGVTVALLPTVAALQGGLVRVLRPIPPLAWTPFAIIWFGISESAAAFLISIGIFWINYFAALTAVQSVDKDLLEVARAFGHGSTFGQLVKVVMPAASPGILGGLRTGLGQGWMTVVAAELFGIAGIGQRMMEASGLLATDVVVLYMLTIGALYALTDYGFVAMQRRLLAWQK